ncbi:MAG TPA: hypothetical protein VMZ28_24835, partial [Kofleriaceae bacterium]|nr:hypothetical protein [Kofleriaceae bacterium]
MALRPAVALLIMTFLALGSPSAMAAKDGRKPGGAKKKGARTGTSAGQPVRPVRRGTQGGQTLSGTRGRAAMPGASARRPIAEGSAPQRRVASGQQHEAYPTPLHAARAQRRPGRVGRWVAGITVAAVLAIGGFAAGNAFGLGKVIDGWTDRVGTTQQQSPWDNMPSPPPGWHWGPPEGGGPQSPSDLPNLVPNQGTRGQPLTYEEAQ